MRRLILDSNTDKITLSKAINIKKQQNEVTGQSYVERQVAQSAPFLSNYLQKHINRFEMILCKIGSPSVSIFNLKYKIDVETLTL